MSLKIKPIHIQHWEGIENTPALPIALRGQLECAAAGGAQEVGLHYSYNAITATIVGEFAGRPVSEVVGVIVWHAQKEQHRIWLQLGYVVPECRGRGVYSHLWRALIGKAKELGVNYIDSGTSRDNDRVLQIASHQGREVHAILLRYKLNKPNPGETYAD